MIAAQKHEPRLIVIAAPSGGGKTTLCQRLLAEFPDLRLSISSTTRAPRGNEQNGREYFFLSREEFERKVAQGGFAEYALVHGNLYGTSKDAIEGFLEQGKSVLLDIDVQGAESFRLAYGPRCYSVFIAPPSLEVLEQRLRARGTDSDATIQRRIVNAREEMERASEFDRVIVNGDLEQAYGELKSAIRGALQTVNHG